MTTARRAALFALAAVALLGTSACASVPAPPAPRPAAPKPPEDLLFVIPPGTAAAQMRGDPAFSLPPTIQVAAGQAIAVRNEDSAMHYFFSLPIAPGQTVRKAFDQPGRYGYTTVLSCSIASTETLTVEVTAPDGRA